MTDTRITVQRARPADVDRIEAVLDANDLPNADVRSKPECFFLAHVQGEFVGIGGVEIHGSHGLLRSVVVQEPFRGQGYGTALCDALESAAADEGIETLYLLTTTAAAFFRARGYVTVDRNEVPERVRETSEFTDLCPSSATCLAKDLWSNPD